MKKVLFTLTLSALFLASCKERNDIINFKPETESLFIDSFYDGQDEPAQDKNIHIEDFTGVQCPNCPKAQERAEKIATDNEGKVVITAIHVTSLANPYPESKLDFRTKDAPLVFSMVGPDPGALPMGDINRRIFTGKTTPFLNYVEWESKATEELSVPTPVNLSFPIVEFNEATRELKVRIKIVYTGNVTDTNYISVALKESGMIDVQAMPPPAPKDDNYVHKHVLRAMVAPYNGLMLGSNMQPGKTYVVGFTRKLDAAWDPDHFSITAFVHNRSGKNLEILQVQETEIK